MSEDEIYPSMVIRIQAEAIELLEQENKQLKADLTKEKLAYSNLRDTYNKKYDECKLYKEVIEEVREYVNNHIHQETFTGYMDSYELKKLLQILDKGEIK